MENHKNDRSVSQSTIDEEIENAWREKELVDAEENYYREQQISDEIQQSWMEKAMKEDGYSDEEIKNAIGDEFLNTDFNRYQDDEYDNLEIDNTDLNGEYENQYVYIRLNNNFNEVRNRLKTSEKKLCQKFPAIQNMQVDNRLKTILENEFPSGFPKNIYIRNLTFQKGTKDISVLAIRPEMAPGDYLLELLSDGITLMFRGHIWGREFIVDDIYDTADTEQLDFEVAASINPRNNPNDVRSNFFFDILEKTESLAKYTSERLEDWKEYLQWYR